MKSLFTRAVPILSNLSKKSFTSPSTTSCSQSQKSVPWGHANSFGEKQHTLNELFDSEKRSSRRYGYVVGAVAGSLITAMIMKEDKDKETKTSLRP